MAGDWIKLEHVTPDKPEVHLIGEQMGVDPNAVLGALIRIWIWADQQTIVGNAPSVTDSLIDRIACARGIAKAMQKVGWLRLTDGGVEFPNFDRHNGSTAKTRGLTLRRVNKVRNASSVTKALPEVEVVCSSPKNTLREEVECATHECPPEFLVELKRLAKLFAKLYPGPPERAPLRPDEVEKCFKRFESCALSIAEIEAELEKKGRKPEYPREFVSRLLGEPSNANGFSAKLKARLERE